MTDENEGPKEIDLTDPIYKDDQTAVDPDALAEAVRKVAEEIKEGKKTD